MFALTRKSPLPPFFKGGNVRWIADAIAVDIEPNPLCKRASAAAPPGGFAHLALSIHP